MMEKKKIHTKEELLRNLSEWIKHKNDFTTKEATNYARENSSLRLYIGTNRIAKYLRQTKEVEFDKSERKWRKRLEPRVVVGIKE